MDHANNLKIHVVASLRYEISYCLINICRIKFKMNFQIPLLQFLKDNGLFILGIVAAVCLFGLAVYFITHRNQPEDSERVKTETNIEAREIERNNETI